MGATESSHLPQRRTDVFVGQQVTGACWEGKLFFCPDIGHPQTFETYDHGDLQGALKRRLRDESLVGIGIFTLALDEHQVTSWYFHHMFVAIKTAGNCFTIEKDAPGIHLVCLGSPAKVITGRPSVGGGAVQRRIGDRAIGTMYRLLDWLHRTRQLSKAYNIVTMNCKDFGTELFNMFSKTKTYRPVGVVTAFARSAVTAPIMLLLQHLAPHAQSEEDGSELFWFWED
jgi:hypothetical protein